MILGVQPRTHAKGRVGMGMKRGLDVGLDAEMDCVYRVRHEERRVRKGRIR